jgi:ATP/maltotriose-dependent transcriptional regulator MalT/two-component SAPR family response regulator
VPHLTEVIVTKLVPPRIGAGLIERPRLLEVFSQLMERKATFLVAPAGYGKTTLILQAAASTQKPLIWYQPDAYDNDISVFLKHLIAGIERHLGSPCPRMPSPLQPVPGESGSHRRSPVGALVNYLAARVGDGILMVLDDYHVVTDPLIHGFVRDLISCLPAGVHIIIASRTSLPPSFSRFLCTGQGIIIGAPTLRFTAEEMEALLSQESRSRNIRTESFRIRNIRKGILHKRDIGSEGLHDVPLQALLDFEHMTGGWPIALTLLPEFIAQSAAMRFDAMRSSAMSSNVMPSDTLDDDSLRSSAYSDFFLRDTRHPDSKTRAIYEYLETEVLNQQPDDVRRFLLATSVLDSMTPANCDSLLGITDSSRLLDHLRLEQLFLVPLEGDKKAYRYHELFRRFLLNQLGPERKSLLLQAGLMARQAWELEEAAGYFSLAEAKENTISVIRDIAGQALRVGRWQTAAKWLGRISAMDLASDPWLSLYKAHVEASRGKLTDAETWVVRANAMFESANERLGLAEGQVLMARILRSRGRCHESMALLDQACSNLTEQEISERFHIPLERALNLFMTGELYKAEALLIGALRQAQEENDGLILSYIAENLGNLSYIQGDCQEALRIFKIGIEASPESTLPGHWLEESRCWIYLGWGQLDQALEHAKQNLEAKEKLGPTGTLPAAYVYVGCVYTELGELGLAEEYYRKALQLGEDPFAHALGKAHLARCLSFQGHWTEALAEAKKVLDQVESESILHALCRVVASTVFIQVGDLLQARFLLQEAISFMEECKMSGQPLCSAYGLLSGILFSLEDISHAHILAAKDYARRHVTLAAGMNYVQNLLMKANDLYDPILRECLENGFEVDFCQRVLVLRGIRSLGLLSKLAAHSNPDVRARTITPLADIGGEKAGDIVRSLTEDPDPQVRQRARAATRRFSEETTVQEPPKDIPTLQLLTLGPFRVIVKGQEVTASRWRTTKARDLLAYLAHRTEPVTSEKVLEDLWPGVEKRRASTSFHSTMYRLRQALRHVSSADFILHSGKRYQLAKGLVSTDRKRFEELAESILKADISRETVSYLEEMVSLYRGEYLMDLGYVWIIQDREHLKRLHSDACLKLARFYLKEGEYTEAAKHLRRLVAINPVSEELCCLLMRAYAGLGDRLAITEQFLSLKTALADELGLIPSAATRDLYYSLCGDDTL